MRMILRACIVIACFVLALLFGRYTMANNFRTWDDEGYVLLSVARHMAGGHLYTQVFSQYGPFFFFVEEGFLRLLGQPVTHDSGRVVTLICWMISAVAAGYYVYRISKNTVLASAAGLAGMSLGKVLANEPVHPQHVVLPLMMLGCCAAASSGPVGLVLLGALGAGLMFIKINVGIFYFAAVALALVCRFPKGRLRTAGAVVLVAYAAVVPLFLMRHDIPGWAVGYALMATLCGVSVFLTGLLTGPATLNPMRNVVYAGGGAVGAIALIVIGAMLEGMSFNTLLDGVIRMPLKHPGVFDVPLRISMRGVLFAAVLSAGVVGIAWFRDRLRPYANWIDVARCLAGVGVIAVLTADQEPSHIVIVLRDLVMLLPLGLIPAGGREWDAEEYFPRVFVTALAATQFLQPYPVAGSHLNIAAEPVLLWAFMCVHDGLGGVVGLAPRMASRWGDLHWKESIVGGAMIVLLAVAMLRTGVLSGRYAYPASALPNTSSLHLAPELEETYEYLTENIRANCDVLFSLPELGSFNLWSGVPPPNGLNVTVWVKGLNAKQQQQIFDDLQKSPRACVVYNEKIALQWGPTHENLDSLPLTHYILYDMPKVAEMRGYEIRVLPQRKAAWVDAAARTGR